MGLFASETPTKCNEGWEVHIVDENGKHHNKIIKKTKEEAEKAIKDINDKADQAFHNSMVNIQSDLPIDDLPGFNTEKEEEFDARLEEIEIEAKSKAKEYLSKILDLFFTSRHINNDEYAKSKYELEEMTLASMIEQLQVSKMIARKLAKQIYSQNNVGARMYEVYGSLNRVILDSGKFLHEYMSSLEENAKNISAEHDQVAQIEGSNNGDSISMLPGGDATFNNATNLLNFVKDMANQISIQYKTPGSRNPKLKSKVNTDEIEEVAYTESEEEKLDDDYDPFDTSIKINKI